MKRVLSVLLAIFVSSSGASEALGPVYPIAEVDLLALIKTHASEEKANWAARQRQLEADWRRYADTPSGLAMPQATENRAWKFEVTLQDHVLSEGSERHWLFIDARDADQLKLAQRFMTDQTVATHRVVLVNGSVAQTQNTLKTRVWFDQGGKLVERLQVRALPAYVKFTREAIYVTEMKP